MIKSTFEEVIQKMGRLVYTNEGDSMMPLLRQKRDLVVIGKPCGRCRKYDVALYKRDSGQYVLHRVLKVRREDYVICGDHRWQREYGVTDRHVIGVMTAVVRDGREISVRDLQYRIYVHLWCDLFYFRAGILWLKAFPRRLKRKLGR